MSSAARAMIEKMPAAFLPDKAGDATARIQLDLTGDGGGAWLLDIAERQCTVTEEKGSQVDVTVTMDAGDFVALYSNKLNPVQAFMSGRIKVAGNVGMVMQLMNWFER